MDQAPLPGAHRATHVIDGVMDFSNGLLYLLAMKIRTLLGVLLLSSSLSAHAAQMVFESDSLRDLPRLSNVRLVGSARGRALNVDVHSCDPRELSLQVVQIAPQQGGNGSIYLVRVNDRDGVDCRSAGVTRTYELAVPEQFSYRDDVVVMNPVAYEHRSYGIRPGQ